MMGSIAVKMKRLTSMLLCCIMISLALSHIGTVDVYADTDTNTKGSRIIVSLGDSYSSGEGIEDFYGQDESIYDKVNNQDWLAHRSEESWSGRLTLDGVSGTMSENRNTYWYFVASSGAETVHLKDEIQYKAYNNEGVSGYDYIDRQLDIFDELGDQKAEYVTVTIGGNDANFSDIITEAVMPHPFNPGALNDKLSDVWQEYYYGNEDEESIRDRLYQSYHDIQEAAGPQAKIIVAGYPKLLDPKGSNVVFSENDAELINDSVSRFNDEIETIVNTCKTEGMKICFVDVEKAFEGHGAYADKPYINKVIFDDYIAGKTEDLVDFAHTYRNENGEEKRALTASSYSMHPNKEGAKIYAECVQDKIDDIEKDNGRSEWPLLSGSDERVIALVLDLSGSMAGTPLEETKSASEKFVSTILKEDAGIGVVAYDDRSMCLSDFCMNEQYLTNVIQNINSGGGTNMEAGLSEAYSMLQSSQAKKKIIVLMSDGEPNEGKIGDELIEYAESIKDEGIYIYTLGFFSNLYDKTAPQALLESIASDGCHFEVDNAGDLVFFFGDIADQINGQKYIYIRIACPVDVTVKHDGEKLCSKENKLSTRTEFGTLTFEENGEETDEDSGSDTRIKVLRLKEGTDYEIQIEGNGRGSMDYTIGFMDDSGEYTDLRKFRNIKITKRTVIDTVATRSSSTVLNVDEDGDGKYDLKYKATENGRGELVDYTYVIYIAVGVVAFILILIIVIKIRKYRKTRKNKPKTQNQYNKIKVCKNCGTQFDDKAKVCGRCGIPL